MLVLRPTLLSRLLVILFGMVLAFAAPPVQAASWSTPVDGYAYRTKVGELALRREIETLTAGGAAYRMPDAERDRLWRLQLAANASSPEDYRDQERQVLAAIAAVRIDLNTLQAGRYDPQALENRWIKASAAASTPLAKDLLARVYLDQYWPTLDLPKSQEAAFVTLYITEQLKIIRANTTWLRSVLANIGWFDIRRFGPEASQGAWLIVQHADHDPVWQSQVLVPLAERVKRGDMQANYYAYLVDRVEHNAGRPQVYGTQGTCAANGWEPFATIDPSALDRRRATMGLPPEAEYRARFTCTAK